MASKLFSAKYAGPCAGCSLPVKRGDLIGYHGHNEKPTCSDCWVEGMPLIPNQTHKQDYGLPKYVREALKRRGHIDPW